MNPCDQNNTNLKTISKDLVKRENEFIEPYKGNNLY